MIVYRPSLARQVRLRSSCAQWYEEDALANDMQKYRLILVTDYVVTQYRLVRITFLLHSKKGLLRHGFRLLIKTVRLSN